MTATIRQRQPTHRALIALIVFPAVLFVVAGFFGDEGAADHARLHAVQALVAASVAAAVVSRWRTAGLAAWAPAIGFMAFAIAQFLEGIGALGYDTIRDTRGDLAVVHDFGLGATAIGLLAVVLGTTVGLAVASGRQHGPIRLVGGGIVVAVLLGGLFVTKILLGF